MRPSVWLKCLSVTRDADMSVLSVIPSILHAYPSKRRSFLPSIYLLDILSYRVGRIVYQISAIESDRVAGKRRKREGKAERVRVVERGEEREGGRERGEKGERKRGRGREEGKKVREGGRKRERGRHGENRRTKEGKREGRGREVSPEANIHKVRQTYRRSRPRLS